MRGTPYTKKAIVMKWNNIVSFALVLIVLALFAERCGYSKALDGALWQLGEANTSIDHHIAKNGELIESKKVIEVQSAEQIAGLKHELDSLNLAKPRIVIRYKSDFKTDTLHYAFVDSIPCADFIEPFTLDSVFVRFDGVVTNKTLSIFNLTVPNEQSIILAEKAKAHWYSARNDSIHAVITNTNPKIKGRELSAYVIKAPVKWYEKRKNWFAAGLFTGAIAVAILK